MKSAWYIGILIMTSSKQRIICKINWSNFMNSKSRFFFFFDSPTKLKMCSIANSVITVTMMVGLPNTKTSSSYLFNTASVTTLAMIRNVVSYRPNCLLIVSMNPKKYCERPHPQPVFWC